jgi:hypothetical protein
VLDLSILELTAVVLGSASAGSYLGIKLYQRWLDGAVVDLDAFAADRFPDRHLKQ